MGAGNQEEVEDITPDLLTISLIAITIGDVVQFLALRDLLAETEVKPTLEKNEQGRDSTDKGKDIGFPLGRSNSNGSKPSANQPQYDSPSLSSLQLTHVATVLRDIAVAPFSCNEVNIIRHVKRPKGDKNTKFLCPCLSRSVLTGYHK